MMTSSPAFRSTPFETRLFDSLVLRVMTISSGVTRRNSASSFRVFSRPSPSFTRLSKEGSWSMSFVIRYIVSSTGPDEGQRLAAFSMVRSRGITNCSRTLIQNFSSGDAGVGGSFAVRAQVSSGVTNGAAPPMASSRANSRRFMHPPRPGGSRTRRERPVEQIHLHSGSAASRLRAHQRSRCDVDLLHGLPGPILRHAIPAGTHYDGLLE